MGYPCWSLGYSHGRLQSDGRWPLRGGGTLGGAAVGGVATTGVTRGCGVPLVLGNRPPRPSCHPAAELGISLVSGPCRNLHGGIASAAAPVDSMLHASGCGDSAYR